MSDADKEQIQMSTKKCTLWDLFHGDDELNKKQKLKEERRKNREAEKSVPDARPVKKVEETEDAKSDKSKEKSEEPEDEEELSEFMVSRFNFQLLTRSILG
jgi:hypothetical protein